MSDHEKPKRGRYAALTPADVWTLICSAMMILAFLLLIWIGAASGGAILSGAALPEGVSSPGALIALIPLAGGVGLILTLLGIVHPERKSVFSALTVIMGVLGIAYYLAFMTANGAYLIGSIRFTGAGFWIALISSLGLIGQMFAPRGRKAAAEDGAKTALGSAANAVGTAGKVITAPVRAALRPFAMGCMALAIGFGACAACAMFLPSSFQVILDIVRSAAVRSYVFVTEVSGRPVLKVVVYEADVSAIAIVQRDMGALSVLWGEGAEIRGTMRVSIGADIVTKEFGILNCAVQTETIQEYIGRAPLAGTAFDASAIRQEAYKAFNDEATKIALEQFWAKAREDMKNRFELWAVGLEVPDEPTLTRCPTTEESPK